MPSITKKTKEFASKPCAIISGIFLVIGIILIIIGAIWLKPKAKTVSQYLEIDYTHCISNKEFVSRDILVECLEHRKTNKACECQHPFTIAEPIMGDNIILYYELESYDQLIASYKNSRHYGILEEKTLRSFPKSCPAESDSLKDLVLEAGTVYLDQLTQINILVYSFKGKAPNRNRDDLQLSGHLSLKPAQQCGSYSYDEERPIAPCGELADRMFTDNFGIRKASMEKYLNVSYYGMITDKGIYRNPERNESETLEHVFKDFAKPKSWRKNIWELDTENEDNNGFENEQFIGWMSTSMKRKPFFRIKQNKIEEGAYVLRVGYNYPPDMYNGTRKVILVANSIITDNSWYSAGATCMVIGPFLIAALCLFIAYRWFTIKGGDMDVSPEEKPLHDSHREPQIVPRAPTSNSNAQ